jgi:hypothetical protein
VILYIVGCGGSYIMTPRAHAGAGVPPANLWRMIENLTVKKDFFYTGKRIMCSTNNLILSLKLMTMKSILLYLFATALLGSFTGLLMSFGSHILPCIGFMSLFWGCMLMPMLGDAK